LLIVEKFFLKKWLDKLPQALRHIYTLFVVMLGWALFSVEDIGALGSFIGRLFVPSATAAADLYQIAGYLPLMAVAMVGATPLAKTVYDKFSAKPAFRYCMIALAAIGLLLCVAALASQSYNPFIYSRF
ncbi:MAG: MBOAT family protein, partial [Oscillospiraceae bacterium]|nr:MBOAT family protein [Oscillospiraceae bacterium]